MEAKWIIFLHTDSFYFSSFLIRLCCEDNNSRWTGISSLHLNYVSRCSDEGKILKPHFLQFASQANWSLETPSTGKQVSSWPDTPFYLPWAIGSQVEFNLSTWVLLAFSQRRITRIVTKVFPGFLIISSRREKIQMARNERKIDFFFRLVPLEVATTSSLRCLELHVQRVHFPSSAHVNLNRTLSPNLNLSFPSPFIPLLSRLSSTY